MSAIQQINPEREITSTSLELSELPSCTQEMTADIDHYKITNVDTLRKIIDTYKKAGKNARKIHTNSNLTNASNRVFALFVTLIFEMIVAFVVSRFVETLKKFCFLMSFQPVVSAMSGNVGLQSSSINIQSNF